MGNLKFQESGSKDAETILFIHGGGISGRMWAGSLRNLSGYYCLAPDLPGHGMSKQLTPFSIDSCVDGLVNLIEDQVPTRKVSVVAFSVGVPVAIELGNRYPDLIAKSFLSGPTPVMNQAAASIINALSRPALALIGKKRRASIVASSLGLSTEQVDSFQEDLQQIAPRLVIEINKAVAEQNDPNPDSPDAVVFVGEKELGAVKQRALDLVRAYGNHAVFVVPNHEHVWCLENPQLFHDTVRRWMEAGDFSGQFDDLAP